MKYMTVMPDSKITDLDVLTLYTVSGAAVTAAQFAMKVAS
jgi:hypothetical protein